MLPLFTSLFTVSILYSYSNQRLFWLGLGILFKVMIFYIIEKIQHHDYINNTERKESVLTSFDIIDTTLSFVLTKIAYDELLFIGSTSHLKTYEYVSVLATICFFVIVVYNKFTKVIS